MKHSLLSLLCLLLAIPIFAQITCSAKDSALFQSKITELESMGLGQGNHRITTIGKSFLGTPYVAKTLEIGDKETLVVNLQGLDCTTFVENVLAFSLLFKGEKHDFNAFVAHLETIRYRDGELNGYPSRLHYFTEWILNNKEKGLVENITSGLGGTAYQKEINFMGTHRELYPFLKDDKNYQKMLEVEDQLAQEEFCVLPQNAIGAAEKNIQSGDIIALATSIKGLDVTHTGFALKMPNGRVHLLHASSTGEVTITREPLVDYLEKIKHNIGILVARPL